MSCLISEILIDSLAPDSFFSRFHVICSERTAHSKRKVYFYLSHSLSLKFYSSKVFSFFNNIQSKQSSVAQEKAKKSIRESQSPKQTRNLLSAPFILQRVRMKRAEHVHCTKKYKWFHSTYFFNKSVQLTFILFSIIIFFLVNLKIKCYLFFERFIWVTSHNFQLGISIHIFFSVYHRVDGDYFYSLHSRNHFEARKC